MKIRPLMWEWWGWKRGWKMWKWRLANMCSAWYVWWQMYANVETLCSFGPSAIMLSASSGLVNENVNKNILAAALSWMKPLDRANPGCRNRSTIMPSHLKPDLVMSSQGGRSWTLASRLDPSWNLDGATGGLVKSRMKISKAQAFRWHLLRPSVVLASCFQTFGRLLGCFRMSEKATWRFRRNRWSGHPWKHQKLICSHQELH